MTDHCPHCRRYRRQAHYVLPTLSALFLIVICYVTQALPRTGAIYVLLAAAVYVIAALIAWNTRYLCEERQQKVDND